MIKSDFILNVCENRGNRRVWIEGKRLADVGIQRGAEYVKTFDFERKILSLDFAPMMDAKTSKVAGTDARPIIDICSKSVTQFMADAETYSVQIFVKGNGIAIDIRPGV